MRIPFPERVPINRVAIFVVVLFLIQWLEGTHLYFSAGCVVFIMIAALAFNTAGGLTRASGAYIFFYSMLVVIVGLCVKAYLGEPADSNLLDPRTDIEVYIAGITGMYAAVFLSRRFSRKSALLQGVLPDSLMYRASIGCMAFGAFGWMVIALSGVGLLQTGFNQLNQLMPLGIIIGVMYEIRSSGGRRSVSLLVLLGGIYFFCFWGLMAFSKQGLLEPIVCWLLPVCALRFRLSAIQIVGCLVGTVIIFQWLVPFAQYGRRFVTPEQTQSERIEVVTRLLGDLEGTRRLYMEEQLQSTPGELGRYFDTPQGFWERLTFVSTDDSLINVTDQGKTVGLGPVMEQFINVVPHFIWPNKPHPRFGGNYYVHEIGGLDPNEGDTTTGISFSPTAEAFHMLRWVGVLVVAPILWFVVFVVFDSLFGDVRATPWGLLVLAQLSHVAPEGAITGLIYFGTFGVVIFVFCALFARWIAPYLAIPVLGPEKRPVPQLSFRPAASPSIQE